MVDGLPTLLVLAGSAGEAIDSGALSFLLQLQLAPRFEEVEEEEQQVDQPVPDSVEWVELCDDYGKTHYWNRRSNETAWNSPKGIKVVWVARRLSGVLYYWHRVTRVSTYGFPPLPPPLIPFIDKVLDIPVMLQRQVSAVQLCRLPGPFIPASWPMKLRPRSSSTSTTACSEQVLLVKMQFVLCSLRLVTGPRSSASWLAWTGREVDIGSCMFTAGFAGDDALRAVSYTVPRSCR